MAGVSFSKWQRQRGGHLGRRGGLPIDLGPLLILVGIVYLYLTFLVLELVRTRELVELEEVAVQPSRWLLVGFVCLSSVLLGLGAVLVLKLNVPRWLSRWWDWLLQER